MQKLGRGVHLDDLVLHRLVVETSGEELLHTAQHSVRPYPLLLAVRQRAEPLDDVVLDPVHGRPPWLVLGVHGGRHRLQRTQDQLIRLLLGDYSLRRGCCEAPV